MQRDIVGCDKNAPIVKGMGIDQHIAHGSAGTLDGNAFIYIQRFQVSTGVNLDDVAICCGCEGCLDRCETPSRAARINT